MTIPNPFSTCDLCDAFRHDSSGAFRVLPPVFQAYGGQLAFAGSVSTVKCHEDNTSVKATILAVKRSAGTGASCAMWSRISHRR